MGSQNTKRTLREEQFPGNESAFDKLTAYVRTNKVTALTGAGVSVPLYPTWSSLLSSTLGEAIRDGIITNEKEIAEYKQLLHSDPLELADLLEQVRSEPIFRAKLASVFRTKEAAATQCHALIARLNVRGIVTLNYDNGHETAYAAKIGRSPNTGKAQDEAVLARWAQSEVFGDFDTPILHLHGDLSDPKQMVLTSSDYERFYSQPLADEFVSSLWRTQRLLAIGFGFTDPFLTRIAERSLRLFQSDLRHYALIGQKKGEPVSSLARTMFAKKYRVEPVFYEVRDNDHSDLQLLLSALDDLNSLAPEPTTTVPRPAEQPLSVNASEKDFKADLFVAPNGATLYAEPRFAMEIVDANPGADAAEMSVIEIVEDPASFIVACRSEYGATTVARRLVHEIGLAGRKVMLRDAQTLPNYRKKLEEVFSASGFSTALSDATLILDNFDIVGNERLLKECLGTKIFSKTIVLVRQNLFETSGGLPGNQYSTPFKSLKLLSLRRSDVRTLTTQFYETSDADLVSSIVERVYGDLVALCIPITPANVVMYLSILHKDGDFQPLNRVQIVNKYLSNLLAGPSDLHRDSFNAKNKLDVISAFVFGLYEADKWRFSEADWLVFCRNHMKATLTQFDERQLLSTLKATRVFVSVGNQLFFKYSFFHTFFLGRQIANRPALMAACIENSRYLRHSGLVEVIAELASDNEPLIEDIVRKTDDALKEFDGRFIPESFDPFSELEWPSSQNEEERLWKPLSKKLAAGPRNPAEIDQIKSSLLDENRAAVQHVVVQQFDRLERRMIALHLALSEAMRNSDSLRANLKRDAVKTLFRGYFRMLQIGVMLAPIIAQKPFVRWHGLAFINQLASLPEEERNRRISRVVVGLVHGVIQVTTEDIASVKLGEVFKSLSEELEGFVRVLNFACLVRAKPKDWLDAASDAISKTGRNTFYLAVMLNTAFAQFNDEVNTTSEREDLKRLIATIKAKRDLNKQHPGKKDLNKFISQLEKTNYFEKKVKAKQDRLSDPDDAPKTP